MEKEDQYFTDPGHEVFKIALLFTHSAEFACMVIRYEVKNTSLSRTIGGNYFIMQCLANLPFPECLIISGSYHDSLLTPTSRKVRS